MIMQMFLSFMKIKSNLARTSRKHKKRRNTKTSFPEQLVEKHTRVMHEIQFCSFLKNDRVHIANYMRKSTSDTS